jgi:hypothetical protein
VCWQKVRFLRERRCLSYGTHHGSFWTFFFKCWRANLYYTTQAAIQDSELVNQFSYKTVPREEIIRLPVKTNKKGRCLSSNVLVKPIRMPNVDGNWRVIIQDIKAIIQRERIVLCTSANDVCQMPGKAFFPLECYTSRCSQKLSVRELLAYDPCESTRGIFVDYFKIPSACSCIFSHSTCWKRISLFCYTISCAAHK